MNNRFLKFALMLSLVSLSNLGFAAKGVTLATASFEDAFKTGEVSFSIKARKSFVTLGNNYGEKIEYSIFRNGKFVHPFESDGGTVVGCRQPFTTPKERNPVQKLVVDGKPRGWIISTELTCGTRSIRRFQVIVAPAGDEETYRFKTVDSNFMGIFVDHDLQIWSFRYGPDCGADTSSYPFVVSLGEQLRVPKDQKDWPKVSDFPYDDGSGKKDSSTIYPESYIDAFVTAFENKNFDLMKHSLSVFKDDEKFDDCVPDFVPRTKSKLKEAVKAFEVLDGQKLWR